VRPQPALTIVVALVMSASACAVGQTGVFVQSRLASQCSQLDRGALMRSCGNRRRQGSNLPGQLAEPTGQRTRPCLLFSWAKGASHMELLPYRVL
jgi:hypothetical protein